MSDAPRPLRADAERNRRRLLDAARQRLAERGFDGGVDEIARVAGVGVGTLYRRFPTKDELLEAIMEDRFGSIGAQLGAAIPDGASPWDAFAAVMRSYTGSVVADRGFLQTMGDRLLDLRGAQRAREQIVATLEPLLHAAQKAGAVRSDVVVGDLTALVISVARMPEWRLRQDPAAWERQLAVVLDGLRGAGAHPLPGAAPAPFFAEPRADSVAGAG